MSPVELIQRLRIKAAMMEMGEKIAWGSDSALMHEAADALAAAVTALAEMRAELEQARKALEDGPTEREIDRLRLAAFTTNSNEDKAAYYLAVSKWFQDRHYRWMDAARALGRTSLKDGEAES